jgi:hypothetical protein
MGVLQKALSGYNPTGAFSFEVFGRNPTTGEKGFRLFESFFLLAPEKYTMQEGYKLKVNKTVGGAWVDDFGNDVKKITLSGSLYSFYFGSPNTPMDAFLDLSAIDFLRGNYAINEFFKLRYIVSRFRDGTSGFVQSNEEAKLIKNYPVLAKFIGDLKKNVRSGKGSFENYLWVYHDYDDNNHFEIIFNDFQTERSKDDPFTLYYTIEMTALKKFESNPNFATKFLRGGLKETYQQLITDTLSTTDDILETAGEVANIPSSVASIYTTTVTGLNQLKQQLNDLNASVSSNWQSLKSFADEKATETQNDLVSISTSSTGTSYDDILDETVDITEEFQDVYNITEKANDIYTQLKAFSLYLTTTEKNRVFVDNEESINTLEFDSEKTADTEGETNEKLEERSATFYTVKDGDNLFKLSKRFYNDTIFSKIIGSVNGLKNADFEGNALSGKVIKIPSLNNASDTNGSNNLVYSDYFFDDTELNRKQKVLGIDIGLTSERDFDTDSTNDLKGIFGEECYTENILDRVQTLQGSLAEIYPEFGVPANIGDVPQELFSQKIEEIILEQVNADPRTEYSYIEGDELVTSGDIISIPLRTKVIEGEEKIVDANIVFN